MSLDRVNKFLANIEEEEKQLKEIQANSVVLDGASVMRNIVISEIKDIARLSNLSSELLGYLSKDLKKLSRKEQQYFWRDVEAVNARKEDWIFKISQEAAKNDFIKKLLNLASQPTETVISENGEVFPSSVTEEEKTKLRALIVDLLNAGAKG